MLLFNKTDSFLSSRRRKFKNILCYCSTGKGWIDGHKIEKFKNILCYCSTPSAISFACAVGYLKTSYVIVQPCISIFDFTPCIHLKTSYVIVQPIPLAFVHFPIPNLKTSYVIVQPSIFCRKSHNKFI